MRNRRRGRRRGRGRKRFRRSSNGKKFYAMRVGLRM